MNSSPTQSAFTMSRSRSGGVTPDGTWDDKAEVVIFDEEWTEEKEQHLVFLEQKLKKANRQWSDEQEEVLGPVGYLSLPHLNDNGSNLCPSAREIT